MAAGAFEAFFTGMFFVAEDNLRRVFQEKVISPSRT
jgi:hypothetical protein